MRTTNTFGVHFIIRMNKCKNGQAPLYSRVVVSNQRVEISIGKSVKITDWNGKKGMLRGSRDEAKSLNHFLEEVRVRPKRLRTNFQEQTRKTTLYAS